MSVVYPSFMVYQSVEKKVIYQNDHMMIIVVKMYSFVYHFSVMHVNFIMVESMFKQKKFIFQYKKKFFFFKNRWFVIKDSYITYMRPDTSEVRFPMLVDRGFQILTGIRKAGTYHGIKIKNLQRTLFVKCRTKRDCDEWEQHFQDLTEQAKDFISATASRFNSYAPVREKQLAYW